ncbi:heat shock 70 kDa protein 14 isoform X1 [Glycine max]|uniref:heat shock 70 kDa protein 14 isoform X1 n=1 Tax=Glycine max TaxID=3847 RepID=UPI001B356DBB|nr:heat shock 70 kDa protein 14 isoform X1 [Glycine max]
MSVVGFDFGNESCIVAVARQRGIDVVLNDESKRETPAIVCFGDKQRFLGTAGAASTMMNPKNSISQIKRLIGRQFADPELQQDIKTFPFVVTEGPDGYPLIHARYLGESRTFTPTQVFGMMLSNLKEIAEKNLNAAVVDCCIGIPLYFTDLQRRAVLDAATIAGLHPLRLFHETTATALAYGIYKTDLPENDQLNVAFVDVGHASMQVCIAGFKKGQLKVLSQSYDRSLGGRDFDEVLFNHFAAKFKEEYKIDVFQNARACLRLRAACEKLKKVLSANPEAPLNIECLMDEKDVRGFIKRDEFEQLSLPILERVKGPLEKALAEAGLTVENVHMVEVVGSGSRVPAINKILTEFFKKEPRRTMNASECVARGCALQCAILSPTFKVREFQVNESFPFSISLSWKAPSSDAQESGPDNKQSTLVFPKGNPIPSVKALTIYRSGTFSIDVQYDDVSGLQTPAKISTYTIGPFQSTKNEKAKVKVKVRLNVHGIISVESATLLEEEEEIEVPVYKEPAGENSKMETDEAPADAAAAAATPSTNDNDVSMQDANTKATANAPGAENGTPEAGDKPVQMDTDTKVEAPKKKVKKINIPVVELVYGAMAATDVQKAVEKEFEMALQDRVMEETKDKKNAVEAYVYDMRNKLNDKYQEFVIDSEREAFTAKLQEVEDWLYEDGEDETKGVYIAKLEELKKQGDPIEERYKEYMERGTVIDQLAYCINSYREAAMSNDPKFDHIDINEKQKVIGYCSDYVSLFFPGCHLAEIIFRFICYQVLNECVEAENWLREKKQHQDSLPKYATPVLLSADVRKKAEAVDRFCKPIMTKPKPLPPKPATPEAPATPPPQGGEQQQQPPQENPNASTNENAGDNANPAPPPASAEPMETDKPENTGSA